MSKDNHGLDQAKAQLASIVAMVAALNCDYDRLEELVEERDELLEAITEAQDDAKDLDYYDPEEVEERQQALLQAKDDLNKWNLDYVDELEELQAAAGDHKNREEAETAIHEDPLSVQVRSDWYSPGDSESESPAEFCVVLATGGPHAELRGELYGGQAQSADVYYSDWGTELTRLSVSNAESEALIEYANQMYFGE